MKKRDITRFDAVPSLVGTQVPTANVSHNDQSMMLCSLNKDLYDARKNGNVTRMKELLTLGANVNQYDQPMM